MAQNEPKIIKVRDLLTNDSLQIPSYQRPYKWTTKNVNQLIDDILIHKDKSEYRLGTLVVHNHFKDKDNKEISEEEYQKDKQNNTIISDIVDGQQRTITLTLIAYAITQKQDKTTEEEKALKSFDPKLLNLSFANDISKANIQNNYKQIERRIADFDEKLIWFFLEKCTLVQVVLNDISEAFQFFDSQNSRGKDLEPHDLLKAFHLREMNNFSTEEERKKTVEKWESLDTAKLSKLFSQYLFRIRNWSKGHSARYFSKNEVDVFKGVSPDIEENYPFAAMLRIAHFYVEEYNSSFHRNIDKREMTFPFQIDETIINGKRFFEMIEHYQIMIDNVKSKEMSERYPILKTIKTYEGSFRTGDKYIRNLFYCGLIYYIDKFGDKDLSKAIDKIFVWAYTLRLKLQAVGLDSVDNFALNRGDHSQIQLFKKIKETIKPNDILNLRLDTLTEIKFPASKNDKVKQIVEHFKTLKYYE
ncbi:DUF262 domain-containing protein [Chryseobacterium limigenitum]|uniref:Uncharacterized protein n=1 Tax=Chryseobacterium limigenitum TaxID=1612149 RepID=A0A1K2IX97_9FLAO|nr:DUF262 domain-containing protein [Chryseobacterium limigenitum]SFZ96910.1 Protein of unknown function DUF262 [Chryseobacterium limigenitum]